MEKFLVVFFFLASVVVVPSLANNHEAVCCEETMGYRTYAVYINRGEGQTLTKPVIVMGNKRENSLAGERNKDKDVGVAILAELVKELPDEAAVEARRAADALQAVYTYIPLMSAHQLEAALRRVGERPDLEYERQRQIVALVEGEKGGPEEKDVYQAAARSLLMAHP